mmetsp:Transcript_87093/g.168705  ORF Transcript_87093/g.168705 Transcript_87093/m.168705 type:complete len:418 (+) Transcript_87093:334-1587(+)
MATADEIEVLKLEEIANAEAALLLNKQLADHPEQLRPALEAWLKMNDEERKAARELHKLGCGSHALELTTAASHKAEMTTIEANMVRSRAARIISRNFRQLHYRTYVAKWQTTTPLSLARSKELFGAAYKPSKELFSAKEKETRPERSGTVYAKMVYKATGGKMAVHVGRWRSRIMLKGYSSSVSGGKKGTGSVGMTGHWSKGPAFSAAAMELRPAHLHMDGKSDLPDPTQFIRSVSQLSSPSGEQGSYHLSEWREMYAWARDNGHVLVTLPAVKGSRQSITVELADAILRNIPVYLAYLGEIRADQNHNKLLRDVYAGVRDVFMIAAVAGRTTVNVTFTQPVTLFTKSNAIGRRDVYSIAGCQERWMVALQKPPPRGSSGEAPPLQQLSLAIIEKHPALAGVYGTWWESKRRQLEP